MSLRPKPGVENIEVCPHGGLDYEELRAAGLAPAAVLDFSVCVNPFMPPPGIWKVLRKVALEVYPDSGASELRQLLAAKLGVPADNILVGGGTTELIRLVALAYFNRGDAVLIPEPTYGEYEVACRIFGAEVSKQRGKAENGFTPDIKETVALIKKHRPRAVFICNPNNPTGKYYSRREIESVGDAIGDGLLILDEAYVTFVENSWPSLDLLSGRNMVILRSMTKDYGLAGLRLGYAVADQVIIDTLRRVCPPWNVNIIAQKAGALVLGNDDYLERSKGKTRGASGFLAKGLSRLGFELVPSDAHFFLVKVGNAAEFRSALLKQGILVRDGTSFGLPEYIRIAPRTLPECRKLIAAIESVFGSQYEISKLRQF